MGYWALKGCEGLAGRLYVGGGRGGETYAETGDENIYFSLRVVRGVRGRCGGRAGGTGAVIAHGCGGGTASNARRATWEDMCNEWVGHYFNTLLQR